MRTRMRKRICLLIALLPLLWGCRDLLAELAQQGEAVEREGMVPVSVILDGGGASRTIAPGHVTAADLSSASYRLRLTGSSDMGGTVDRDNLALTNGQGHVSLGHGNWRLTLTAYTAAGVAALSGSSAVSVEKGARSAEVRFSLAPVAAGTGTVRVEFQLEAAVVSRLDPISDTDPRREVRVALYDVANQEVAGTEQTYQLVYNVGATADYPITYSKTVASGQYTLKLESPYTIQNSSTRDQIVTYRYGWSDIVYVEGGRDSTATVALTASEGGGMSLPGKPYRHDKVNENANTNQQNANFNAATPFNPYKETLWMFGTIWDDSDSDDNGNEVLIIDWDPAYGADYYELELLVSPLAKHGRNPNSYGGKLDKVVSTDAEWDALAQKNDFTRNSQTRMINYLRFSGGDGDPDYYKRRTYEMDCLDANGNFVKFVSCADKNVASSIFTAGGYSTGYVNSGYRVTAGTDAFNNYTEWTYVDMGSTATPKPSKNLGKVGLEGDCSVIGVLLPAYTPQLGVVIRMRSVNRFGYSDWVYWKGGKWL